MSTKPETKPPNPRDSRLWRILHIFTLCSFAVTQPVLVALMKQSVYLHDQRTGWAEVGALLTVLMLLIPLIFVVIDRLWMALLRRFHLYGQDVVLAFLMAVTVLSLVRPMMGIPWIATKGFAGLLAIIAVVPSAWLMTHLYERYSWVRSWLTLASLGLLVFPTTFLWQFHSLYHAEKVIEQGMSVPNPVPIILVVFDEMNGTTLMNEQFELDSQRFPQLSRLSKQSTWYRNATTVHPRTQVAVPAILSGRFPTTELPPLEAKYPGNLLQVIESTKAYDMAVFEPATRLCPASVKSVPRPDVPTFQKCTRLLMTLAAVYPRLILSNDVPAWFPPIPGEWFGMLPKSLSMPSEPQELTEGLFNYFSTANRTGQFHHFLRCVRNSERPRFCFYHTVFPHYPWSYYPTGEQYEIESAAPNFPLGASGELGEDWQKDESIILRSEHRYRHQAQYADRLIGELLDRLEETKLLDECLLIVTADHGVSFRAGHSRRLPDAETLAEIMSVPLFIKMPGKTAGTIDDRNVESIDILPTIAEVIGVELPESVDGISVSRETRHARKTLYFETVMTVVEPDFPQRKAALQRQSKLFGTDESDHAPAGTATHPEWHGKTIESFSIEQPPIAYNKVDPMKSVNPEERPDPSRLVKSFLSGRIDSRDLRSVPADLLVVADGIVVDSGRTSPAWLRTNGFEFLLPKTINESTSHIDIYVVEQNSDVPRLRQLVPRFDETEHQ